MTAAAPRALVAGLGLIGGSIGQALRARGWRVSYLDPNVRLADARHAGAADERVNDFGGAGFVIIATPVDVATDMMTLMPVVRCTTVCSVMGPLRAIADQRKLPFTAGHPMAGSHERGLRAARADLLAGKTWFVDSDDELVMRMIADCGANADRVDADKHDRAVALTSHLPQLLSTALGALLEQRGDLRFAGSGLETFLRLAGSDASVWQPVFEANREDIAEALNDVFRIARRILEGDAEAFARAQRALQNLRRTT